MSLLYGVHVSPIVSQCSYKHVCSLSQGDDDTASELSSSLPNTNYLTVPRLP